MDMSGPESPADGEGFIAASSTDVLAATVHNSGPGTTSSSDGEGNYFSN